MWTKNVNMKDGQLNNWPNFLTFCIKAVDVLYWFVDFGSDLFYPVWNNISHRWCDRLIQGQFCRIVDFQLGSPASIVHLKTGRWFFSRDFLVHTYGSLFVQLGRMSFFLGMTNDCMNNMFVCTGFLWRNLLCLNNQCNRSRQSRTPPIGSR